MEGALGRLFCDQDPFDGIIAIIETAKDSKDFAESSLADQLHGMIRDFIQR
jgi:hypothetical protein